MSSHLPSVSDGKPGKGYALILFLAGILFSIIGYFVLESLTKTENELQTNPNYTIQRINGFKNVRPVLSVQTNEEATELVPLKQKLNSFIDGAKMEGEVDEISVYLRGFNHGSWININGEQQYHPASLMKVAMLICYLHMAESNPGLLEKELLFEKPEEGKITPQYYHDLCIIPGEKYKIHELLVYMIAYSDNNATWLLSQYFDTKMLFKLFSDLGLRPPLQDELAFQMTAKEYSTFFSAIYNSSYLTSEYSDYAAELLRHCSFKEGFANGIGHDRDSLMWHKFGEWRQPGQDYELHESGVIHVKGKPYLLTVMTRGKNTDKLAAAISKVSGTVFEFLDRP